MKTRKRKRSGSPQPRGAPPTQNTVIKLLREIGEKRCYVINLRSQPKNKMDLDKEFRPDILAEHAMNMKARIVFEVEATVTNNTIFKSIMSLLYTIHKKLAVSGCLVIPDKHKDFATQCLNIAFEVTRSFGRRVRGANKKIPISIATFNQVRKEHKKFEDWWHKNKRQGQPPKSELFPRP